MLTESNIVCFLSLSETLSFTESAKRLYLSQQAVSRNIMQLESDLGFPLVNRNGRAISLTPAGIKCADLFRELSGRYSEQIEVIKKENINNISSISAGFQNYLDFGAELFKGNEQLRSKYPDIVLKVERQSPGMLIKKLYNGTLDLIVLHRRYAPDNSDYEIRDLFNVHLHILVSPNNPNVTEAATYLDFKNQPFIIDVFEDETDKSLAERARKEIDLIGFDPVSLITVPNRDSAYITAELSNGIILSSDISQSGKGPNLLHYRVGITDAVCCVWKKREMNNAVLTYVDILTSVFSNVK